MIDQRLDKFGCRDRRAVGRSIHRDAASLDRPGPFLNLCLDEFLQIFRRAALARDEIGADLVAHERSSPDYLQKFVETEIEKWAGPIKASGVSMD